MKLNQKNISIIKSITNKQKISNFRKKSPIFENRIWLISLYFIKLQIIKCSQKWEKWHFLGPFGTLWDFLGLFGTFFPTKCGKMELLSQKKTENKLLLSKIT